MKYHHYANYAKPLVIAGAGFAKHAYDKWQEGRGHHHVKSISGKHHYSPHHPHAFKPHFRHQFGKPRSHARAAEVFTKTTVIHRKKNHLSAKAVLHKPSKIVKVYGTSTATIATAAGVVRAAQSVQNVVEDIAFPTLATVQGYWTNYWIQSGTSGVLTQPVALTSGINAQRAGNTQDILLHYVKKEYMITNLATAPSYITLYDFEYKHANAPALTANVGMKTLWAAGLADQEQVSSASNDNTQIGASPLDVERFKVHWKLRKMNKLLIQPGQVWHHTVYTQYEKRFKGEEFADIQVANDLPLPGSLGLLIVAYGVPATDAGGTSAICTTAPTSIGVIEKVTVKFRPYSMPFNNRYTSLTSAVATVTTPTLIDTETDAAITAATV